MKYMKQCYELLRDVLKDAFNVSSVYFTPPYTDIQKIDIGLRAAVWSNYSDGNAASLLLNSSNPYRILIIKSNLGFYNILITLSCDPKPDFITIGPFRNDELSANYFTKILKDAHIAPSTIQSMKHIYETLPYVQVDTVVNVSRRILERFIPEFREIETELVEYSHDNRPVEVNTDVIHQNFFAFSEQYQSMLSVFLRYINLGDSSGAKAALRELLQAFQIGQNTNMRNYKTFLMTLNNYCHMSLLNTDIHPSYVLKLAISISTRIESVMSPSKAEQIINDICRKYCLLVKNYANSNVSKLTKDAMAYIQSHIEEELSLSRLARLFQKNATVFSDIFHKETGQTLTSFIQHTRVQEAIRLFNTTDLSISEVAATVGYQDFSYFSKTFSKIVGMSPRAYKKKALT